MPGPPRGEVTASGYLEAVSTTQLLLAIVVISAVFCAVVVYGYVRFSRFRAKEMESSRRFREMHGDTRRNPDNTPNP